MTTGAPAAVFFLGTRAHYQVLNQPDAQFDAENNEVYQNGGGAWRPGDCAPALQDYSGGYNVLDDVNVPEDQERTSLKRNKRRTSEATLTDMKPSQLNNVNDNASPKEKSSRRSLLAFLASLSRRKKRHDLQYLQHVESVLTTCTYRESCRCLECQSSYFDCDLDEEYCESDDDSEYNHYVAQMQQRQQRQQPSDDEDDDDEVFVEQPASDSTSTDMLLEPQKMSVSSDSSEDAETMHLEVAAGTPLLLNFLLTHPITCSIQ